MRKKLLKTESVMPSSFYFWKDLKIFSENVKILKEYSCLEGEKEVNRKKNRYKDILPFDISRVVLAEYAGIPGSDYINANFIKGASGSPAYIASQGPLPSTVNDFWRMVVQCEVQVIVMACNEEEAGKAKCEKYWVDEGDEKQFGMISVKLLKSSTVCPDFSVRTMRLKYTTNQQIIEERTVCQLHYVAWPDHGVPTVVQPLLDMVRLVRDTQASETLPVLVHCSAGCGRTGTICAIDYVWGLLRTGKLTNDFSLLSLIRDMRKQRIAMVQTKEQYVLVHQAVRELFKEQLCMIDSHPYENVDPDGLLIMKEEENPYDCIEYSSTCSEEKRDNKEKEIVPPPLPSKKNVNKFPSKFEKDVENLTEQQRSMNYMANVRGLVPFCQITGKKKVNNKELDNFEKINKKVHDNKIKLDSNKPIPSKGILRVPQLETVLPKCTAGIKRSKSLKIVSNCDKNSLSFCQNSPVENKRRSSLESNIDEHIFELDCNNHLISRPDIEPVHNLKQKGNPQVVNKYDIIKNQDHRTFIRSLTSVDMRPKIACGSSNALVSSLENSLAKQKYKLLRSNTQVNILKRSNTTSQLKSDFLSISDSASNVKYNSNSQFSNNKMNHNNSHENVLERKLKFRPKPSGNTTFTTQHPNLRQKSISKDIHAKTRDQAESSFQKVELSKHSKEHTIFRSNGSDSLDHLSNTPYEEGCVNYPTEKCDNFTVKQEKFGMYGIKMRHPNLYSSDSSEFLPLIYDNSKYIRPNHLMISRTQKKLQPGNVVKQQQTGLTLGIQGCSKDGFSSNLPFHDELSILRQSKANEEFHRTSSHMNEEYLTMSGQKCNNTFNDHYVVDECIENGTNSWMERDNSRIQSNYNKAFIMTKPRGAQSLLVNKHEENKETQRKLESEIDYSRNTNVAGLVDPFEETKCDQDLLAYDLSYNKESIPINSSEMKYTLQNRKNVQQFNSSIHNSRHANTSVPNVCSDLSSSHISRTPCKSSLLQQRSVVTSYSQDSTYFVPEALRNYRDNEYFHSAPGVDLDQVAASITKNDENLMKVTLEELQVRKTKLQMTSKNKVPLKGAAPSLVSGDKKKQQQYL